MLMPREQGFGLIELVVAMVISLVAVSVFVMLFKDGLMRSNDADAQSISSSRITESLDRLGDDVRATRSAGRGDISTISTKDDLQTRMLADPTRYGDVAIAQGRMLALWSDAEGDPAGPRCATYSLEQVTEAKVLVWALVRRSGAPGGACPVVNGQGEVLASLGTAPPARDAFQYGILENIGAVANRTCRTRIAAPSDVNTAGERLRIISVDVDLGSIGQRRGAQRISNGRSSMDIWSRINDDYYYAMGCSI